MGSQSNHCRPARLFLSLRRQGTSFERAGLSSARISHGVDDLAAVFGASPEGAAQLALYGSAFRAARTESHRAAGEASAFLDEVEQGLAGGDARQNERHARRDGVLDEGNRSGPFDIAEGGVNDEELFEGDDA